MYTFVGSSKPGDNTMVINIMRMVWFPRYIMLAYYIAENTSPCAVPCFKILMSPKVIISAGSLSIGDSDSCHNQFVHTENLKKKSVS